MPQWSLSIEVFHPPDLWMNMEKILFVWMCIEYEYVFPVPWAIDDCGEYNCTCIEIER